jgi:hypothetical protein
MRYLIILLLVLPTVIAAQHTLILKSGERMSGEVISIADGSLSFLYKGNTMKFKMNELQSVQFSELQAAPKPSGQSTVSGTKGVSFVMNGRKMTRQPVINNLTTEKGIVVVEITINKYGNVIKAEPGAEGTTTASQYLLTKAKQAAESVTFDSAPTSPLEQKGTITITF